MKDLVKIGSETAKGGFANEDKIAEKFEAWKTDKEAQKWLTIMKYDLKKIKQVEAVVLSNKYKADVQIKVLIRMEKAIGVQNISIKKANDDSDFNQADKRWVDKYGEMWNLPDTLTELLKIFSGEVSPQELLREHKINKEKYDSLKDKRRFFLTEFKEKNVKKLVDFFRKHKIKIVADIIKGEGDFSADWMLVTKYYKSKNETEWILKDINYAMNVFGNGDVVVTPRGSLHIGRIAMQRKGGDGGRKTANMLQFKISPCDLFKY